MFICGDLCKASIRSGTFQFHISVIAAATKSIPMEDWSETLCPSCVSTAKILKCSEETAVVVFQSFLSNGVITGTQRNNIPNVPRRV
jgi:hypothetical protein